MLNLGDLNTSETAIILFSTFGGSAESITITGLAVTDIEVFKDGSATTRASDNGYTLLDTDGIDFASITGVHGISIDLSDNSDAGFYANDSSYYVVISAITVNSQTVSFVAATFTIGRSLRPTTAGRTLDIQATGEADVNLTMMGGVVQSGTDLKDFADEGYDPATNKVQGVVLVDTLTTNSDKTGYSVSAAVASFFQDFFTVDSGEVSGSEVSGSVALEFTKINWDRALTGATHNISTSSGRRLRAIQDFGNYLGQVHIDTINGSPGTTLEENGTVDNPVDNLADALTLNATLGYNSFNLKPRSSITFISAQEGKVFSGEDSWTLALGNQSIDGSTFIGATVSGIGTSTAGRQAFHRCVMNATTLPANTLFCTGTQIAGTLTAGAEGDYFFHTCFSGIAGTDTWTFDFGSAVGATNLNVRANSGGIQLENMGDAGTDTASIEGWGQIIEGTCTSGTVAVRGNFTRSSLVTNNITWSEDARIDIGQITAAALVTQMAESYAADGVAPTLTQAVLLIQQMLTEFAILSTTLTAKKLDGSATAATFTLNDATDPTSLTRAT